MAWPLGRTQPRWAKVQGSRFEGGAERWRLAGWVHMATRALGPYGHAGIGVRDWQALAFQAVVLHGQ